MEHLPDLLMERARHCRFSKTRDQYALVEWFDNFERTHELLAISYTGNPYFFDADSISRKGQILDIPRNTWPLFLQLRTRRQGQPFQSSGPSTKSTAVSLAGCFSSLSLKKAMVLGYSELRSICVKLYLSWGEAARRTIWLLGRRLCFMGLKSVWGFK